MTEDTYCVQCEAYHYGGHYCGRCGTPLVAASYVVQCCRHCGADVAYDDNFCRWCGKKLETEEKR